MVYRPKPRYCEDGQHTECVDKVPKNDQDFISHNLLPLMKNQTFLSYNVFKSAVNQEHRTMGTI
jgi:hypothetical protein